jgi:hypothetical protein
MNIYASCRLLKRNLIFRSSKALNIILFLKKKKMEKGKCHFVFFHPSILYFVRNPLIHSYYFILIEDDSFPSHVTWFPRTTFSEIKIDFFSYRNHTSKIGAENRKGI